VCYFIFGTEPSALTWLAHTNRWLNMANGQKDN